MCIRDSNEGLAENFVKEFESLGGTIVDQESYSEGDVDFKTQLTTILGKAPETGSGPLPRSSWGRRRHTR